KHVKTALAVGERPHTATSTCTSRLQKSLFLRGESFAIVSRLSNPNTPVALIFGAWFRSVPGYVNISFAIGSERPAAVQTISELDDVSFLLKGGPFIIQPSIEHREFAPRTFSDSLFRSHPSNVDLIVFPNGQVSSAHVANCHGAARAVINSDWIGEFFLTFFQANVVKISVTWIATEINQVNRANGVH